VVGSVEITCLGLQTINNVFKGSARTLKVRQQLWMAYRPTRHHFDVLTVL
jgi:hypothetical protein